MFQFVTNNLSSEILWVSYNWLRIFPVMICYVGETGFWAQLPKGSCSYEDSVLEDRSVIQKSEVTQSPSELSYVFVGEFSLDVPNFLSKNVG
jgi:hypothetical protein